MFQGSSLHDAVLGIIASQVGQILASGGKVLRQPSILDVVHGVKSVVPAHPEVTAWWYTPPQRLRLAGDLPGSGSAAIPIEVVVQSAGTGEIPCAEIAKELSAALGGSPVGVRLHRGDREQRPLFRIVSQDTSSSSEAPRPA